MKPRINESIPAPAEGWRMEAECRRRDPELWWAVDEEGRRYAADICFYDCPVRRDCGLFALRTDERFGIWAGHNMGDAWDVRRLAQDLGLTAPHRGSRRNRARTHLCSECGSSFVTTSSDRTQCEPCSAGRMPVAFAREFLTELMGIEGMTYQRVADLAGDPVTRSWVAKVAAGSSKFVSTEHVRSLMSISVPAARAAVAEALGVAS